MFPLVRRIFVVLVSVLSLIALVATAANADEVGPAPEPPPVIWPDGQLCNPYGIGIYTTSLPYPQLVDEGAGPSANGPLRGNGVYGEGSITVGSNTSCSHAQVQFALQSRYCNRLGWNCNWRSIKESEWMMLPIQGRLTYNMTGACRSGTDRYRMLATVSHVELSFEETPDGKRFVPFLETKTEEKGEDNWVELNCD